MRVNSACVMAMQKVTQSCGLYWLQCAQRTCWNGHGFLQLNSPSVTFSAVRVDQHRHIRSLSHHNNESQAGKHLLLMTKRLCASSADRKCWSCGTSAPSFFCPACKLVQPPTKSSYFEIMDWWESPVLCVWRLCGYWNLKMVLLSTE